MTIVEILSLLTNVGLAAYWFYGKDSRWAPFCGMLNCIFWLLYVLVVNNLALLPNMICFFGIHVFNFFRWHRRHR